MDQLIQRIGAEWPLRSTLGRNRGNDWLVHGSLRFYRRDPSCTDSLIDLGDDILRKVQYKAPREGESFDTIHWIKEE